MSAEERREHDNLLNTGRDGMFKELVRRQFGRNGIALTTNLTFVFVLLICFVLCMMAILSSVYSNDVTAIQQRIQDKLLSTDYELV